MYDYIEKNNEYYQKLRKKRRLKNRIFSLAIMIILVLSLWFRSNILKQDYIPKEASEGYYWILFIIERINFILILLLFMLISREIIMLVLEWYQKKTGTHFKAKVVLIFLILAIVPTAFTIYISSRLLKFSIDQWFDIDFSKNIQYSQSIADNYLQLQREYLSSITEDISESIKSAGGDTESIQKILSESPVFENKKSFIKGIMVILNKKAIFSNIKDSYIEGYISREVINQADIGDALLEGKILSDKDTYLILKHIISDVPDMLIMSYNIIPSEISGFLDEIYRFSSKFEQQSVLQASMKNYYYYSLMLISTLIIFMAVWFGLHFSKEITVPIVSLIRGTQKIAKGDFNFMLEKHSGQEIGTLIDSFNLMIRDIKQSRDSLQKVNESLEHKTVELEAKSRFIELLIQNISSGILVISMDDKVITANRSFLEYFGYKENELIGGNINDIFKENYLPLLSIINRTKMVEKKEISKTLSLDINNVSRTIIATSQVISAGLEKDRHIFMVIEDISDIIRAEKLTAWKEVAKRIAHEIKNPLTPLQLSVQRICRAIDKNKDLSQYKSFFDENRFILEESINTIKVLVNEFHRFAKLPSIVTRKDDINALLSDIYTYYHSQKLKIDLNLELEEGLPNIMLDRETMKRAINNLINNAIEAVSEEGTVTIASLYDKRQDIVAVEIRDNGHGLSKKQKENLFMPYFSTKKEKSGTGLGLSIVLSIVAEHMAYIRVLDNKPGGCIFRIEFPCVKE